MSVVNFLSPDLLQIIPSPYSQKNHYKDFPTLKNCKYSDFTCQKSIVRSTLKHAVLFACLFVCLGVSNLL